MNFILGAKRVFCTSLCFLSLLATPGFCQQPAGRRTMGELQKRSAELAKYLCCEQPRYSFCDDASRRRAMEEMNRRSAASVEFKNVQIEILKLRIYYLQNDVPDDPDNPFMSRRKFNARVQNAKDAQSLFLLNMELMKESLNMPSGGMDVFAYTSQCRACLGQLQQETAAIAAKLPEQERKRFYDDMAQVFNQQTQLLNQLNGSAVPSASYSPDVSRRPVSYKRVCPAHGIEYDLRYGGCPQCRAPKFGF